MRGKSGKYPALNNKGKQQRQEEFKKCLKYRKTTIYTKIRKQKIQNCVGDHIFDV